MAFSPRKNITSALIQDLVSAGDGVRVNSVNIANVHSSNAISVDLFVHNCGTDTYIFKNLSIPTGTSYYMELNGFKIDTKTNGDSLRLKCSSSDGIDVFVNTY